MQRRSCHVLAARPIASFGSRTRHQAVRPRRGRFPVIGSSPHWPGGTGISNLRPLAGWISALERGRFQGHRHSTYILINVKVPGLETGGRFHFVRYADGSVIMRWGACPRIQWHTRLRLEEGARDGSNRLGWLISLPMAYLPCATRTLFSWARSRCTGLILEFSSAPSLPRPCA